MKRKKKLKLTPADVVGLGAGTYIRFPSSTRAWLSSKARSEGDRSVSSVVREIIERAKDADDCDVARAGA